MTFLPIVERELRIASRRKSTFTFRALAATTALLVALFYSMIFGMARLTGVSKGFMLFSSLSWIFFVLSLFAGVMLGADSLSEERREGTLGFLFLTDLKGYDVVLGKFVGVSLNAFYSLFAAIPILALPIMIGGVTGVEYWRTMLALVNTLFYAFAVAICISTCCAAAGKSLAWAGVALAILVICLPAAPLAYDTIRASFVVRLVSGISPMVPFVLAPAAKYAKQGDFYWQSLVLSHIAGWGFIVSACVRLSRSITDGDVQQTNLFYRFSFFKRRDRKLLETNPVAWLLDNQIVRRALFWLAMGFGVVLIAFGSPRQRITSFFRYAGDLYIAFFILKLLVAAQACRLFGTARRDGTFELLCCTPLTDQQLMDGQWSALTRTFLPPALVLFFAQTAVVAFNVFGYSTTRYSGIATVDVLFTFYLLVKLVLDFYAVSWFGMWMALKTRTTARAIAVTVAFTIVLPMVLMCVPDVVTDLVLIAVAQSNLRKRFQFVGRTSMLLPTEALPPQHYGL